MVFVGLMVIVILPLPTGQNVICYIQANQTIFLLSSMGVGWLVLSVFVLREKVKLDQLHIVDVLLLFVLGLTLLNSFVFQTVSAISFRFYDLIGLLMLYFFIRVAVGTKYTWILLIFIVLGVMWQAGKLYRVTSDWNVAFIYYQSGTFSSSLPLYKKVYPVFSRDGTFLSNYGKVLSVTGDHQEAIVVLEEAKKYLGNTIIQTALGNSYQALGRYEKAEEAYQLASDMLPDRFYPKYLLAKLYHAMADRVKMEAIARHLINKDPKVPSRAVEEIKREMQGLLDGSLEKWQQFDADI